MPFKVSQEEDQCNQKLQNALSAKAVLEDLIKEKDQAIVGLQEKLQEQSDEVFELHDRMAEQQEKIVKAAEVHRKLMQNVENIKNDFTKERISLRFRARRIQNNYKLKLRHVIKNFESQAAIQRDNVKNNPGSIELYRLVLTAHQKIEKFQSHMHK